MKKLVKVTREYEVEVEIKDELLTEEAIKEFESYMWKTSVSGLFEYAAKCVVDRDPFVEGLGPTSNKFYQQEDANVKYEVIFDDEEAEVMEDL